jgi:heme/copper-type cytochrome/quinol oxidase subunit 3
MAAAGTMLFGTLIAAYLHLRVLTGRWPPRGVTIDQYLGNLSVLTMLLAAVTVEWARFSLRRGERQQALAALGVTLAFGLAVLNLLSYAAYRVRFDAATHPYGLVVTAMVMLLGITVAIGVALVTMTLFRIVGRQVSAAEPEQLRATAIFWHFCVAASVAVWYTVVVLK